MLHFIHVFSKICNEIQNIEVIHKKRGRLKNGN